MLLFAKFVSFVTFLYYYLLISPARCDIHSNGGYIENIADLILKENVYTRNTSSPTDYIFMFKHVHSMYRGDLLYIKVIISCVSIYLVMSSHSQIEPKASSTSYI